MTGPGIVVVGGSLAAVTAVDALRQNGYAGPITLLGERPVAQRRAGRLLDVS
ncbi:hypothetical protein [Streptomyces sp. NPDC005181]|uniref:hypothetical protein n=1 Tax=Streptomyces sp. NPDC005181 TaxID=3156869 RepID=UPI0033A175F2